MDRYRKLFGIAGITGAALCLLAIAVSAILQDFSPLNGFVTQLGIYPGRLFTVSTALIFNAGLLIFGLTLCAFAVFTGLNEATGFDTAVGFFGALTGVLAIAMALFTLNYAFYHYIVAGAFHISVFILCAFYIVLMVLGHIRLRVATLIVAALAALSSAAFAAFSFSGSMAQVLSLHASDLAPALEPFALVGLGALVFTLVFTMLISAQTLGGEDMAADEPGWQTRKTREIEF